MSVQEQMPIVVYVANGNTNRFAITFDLHDQNYLVVTLNNEVAQVGSYSVLDGEVVFGTAPADGSLVTLYRDTQLNRTTNYKSYDNSFRPESVNWDFDKLWHVLQEQNLIDGKILARIKDEIEWRRTHDFNYDELAQVREKQLFDALKGYSETLLASTNPSVFQGVIAGVVFARDGKSIQTHIEEILDNLELNRSYIDEQVGLMAPQATTYNKIEVDTKIGAETTRAQAAELVLQNQVNAVGVGNKAYLTYAEMDADKANNPVNSKLEVTNDAIESNNGVWQWNGTTLTKSGFDPVGQAKNYADANPLFNPKALELSQDLNTLGTGIYYASDITIGNSILNKPIFPINFFIIEARHLSNGVRYQKATAYRKVNGETLSYERTYNSSDSAWESWEKIFTNSDVAPIVNANNMFQPKGLVENQDLDDLEYGRYYTTGATVGASILNKPDSLPGVAFSVDAFPATNGIRSQTLTYYAESNNQLFIYDRVYNNSLGVWNPWHKRITESDLQGYVKNNLFKQVDFSSAGTSSFQATVLQEEGANVLSMNTDGLRTVYYEYALSDLMKIGDVLSFSADIKTDVTGPTGADISLAFLKADKTTVVGSPLAVTATKADEWHRLSTSVTVPLEAAYVRVRFIRRNGESTYAKFRYPVLVSSSWYAQNLSIGSSSSAANSLFVAKTGSDTNDGSQAKPFLTINRAISALESTGGSITILDSDWYRETVTSSSPHKIVIQSARGKRAKIAGSDRLVVTKTAGYSKVYQAPLAAKPTGMGGAKGQPMIAEWGTKYREIEASDIHALQRGYTHYLPYTPMYEADSLAELDTLTGNGKWWWESGIIYFSATDGSDATLKQYEARMRNSFVRTVGATECYRVDFLFSKLHGYSSTGTHTYREDCAAYGCHQDGFSDQANSTVAYRDIALGNGNDGLNGTVPEYAGTENLETACQATYFDPWCALQGDDGCSFHVRGTCNIYGGLMEYNTKAGVVHVTGGGGNCFNTIARGQDYGFYTATEAPDGRILSSMSCHSTISERNRFNYQASNGAELHCHNTTSIDPGTWGYNAATGTLYTYDAKFIGDSAKAKSGNVVVKNSTSLI